jgi:hypothetical protein
MSPKLNIQLMVFYRGLMHRRILNPLAFQNSFREHVDSMENLFESVGVNLRGVLIDSRSEKGCIYR